MLGLFAQKEIVTDEDYKKSLKKKMIAYRVLFLLGLITIVTFQIAREWFQMTLPDFMMGFYSGIGAGLIGVSLILTLKTRRILRSPEALRRSRIKNTDERNVNISAKSMRTALFVLLIAMYLVMIIGGLWYPILTEVIAGLVYVFLFVYLISYWILSKKM